MDSRTRGTLATLDFVTISVAMYFAVSRPAFAQVSSADAALNGTVRDTSGAVVPGAIVTLTNTKTGVEQNTKSNHTGNYSLVNIVPGTYIATASGTGFSERQVTRV